MSSTRRDFLFAAGSAIALAACGGTPNTPSGSGNTTASGGSSVDGPAPKNFAIVQRFPSSGLFVPGEVRLPVSISDGQSLSSVGPASLKGSIVDFKGNTITTVEGIRRSEGISIPYWEVRAQLTTPMIYTLRLDGDDGVGASFELFDANQIKTPLTGKPLPPFDTPTADNHRGVEPYCSRKPTPCPLHAVTLTDALKSGKPVAYMIGTPAHCQTGSCAPGLEALVNEHSRIGDAMVMVHADVYADDAATVTSPAVAALGVMYEPIVYFTDKSGVVVDRLDGVWDSSELRDRLAKLGF